jgi:hypothetical protein
VVGLPAVPDLWFTRRIARSGMKVCSSSGLGGGKLAGSTIECVKRSVLFLLASLGLWLVPALAEHRAADSIRVADRTGLCLGDVDVACTADEFSGQLRLDLGEIEGEEDDSAPGWSSTGLRVNPGRAPIQRMRVRDAVRCANAQAHEERGPPASVLRA